MDDGLNCGRNVPGITRQTNALSFYSLGNEVDKERSRTASLIYKSIVIGNHANPIFLRIYILFLAAITILPTGAKDHGVTILQEKDRLLHDLGVSQYFVDTKEKI